MVVRLPPQGQALGLARPVPADAPDRRLRRGRPGGRDLQAAVAARAAFVPAPAVLHGLLGRLRQGDPGDPARSDGQGRRTRATARRVMSSVGTTPCGSGWRGSCARRSPSARATGCTGSACCCSSTTTTGPGGSTTIPNRPLPTISCWHFTRWQNPRFLLHDYLTTLTSQNFTSPILLQ